ncbi:Uncharacterised protein [Vibrio cholerae]|nr:Uncharacterised protein [Vibrio cholerae]
MVQGVSPNQWFYSHRPFHLPPVFRALYPIHYLMLRLTVKNLR